MLLLFLAASISVLETAMLRLWLLTALLLRRDACWKIHKGCNKTRVHFYFLVEVLLLLLRAATAAHHISTEAERGTGYCFFLFRLRYYYCCFLCVYSIAVAAVEKGCMPEKTNKNMTFLFRWRCYCCFSLIERDVLKKRRLFFSFCLIRVRNQSR